MNARDLILTLLLGVLLAVLGPAVLRPMIRRASRNLNRPAISIEYPLQFEDSAPLSIPRFASLLTEYYALLIRLSYYTSSEITFPPYVIDTDLCTRLNLSALVIETMRLIVFPKSYTLSFNNAIYPFSRAFVFTDPEDVLASRDPEMPLREAGYAEALSSPEIPPYILPLSRNMIMDYDFNSWIMLLDTRTGTIRPTWAAEEVLREMLENLRTLKWTPMVNLGRKRIIREEGKREWGRLRDRLLDVGWGAGRWNAEELDRIREEVFQEEKERQWEIDKRNGEWWTRESVN